MMYRSELDVSGLLYVSRILIREEGTIEKSASAWVGLLVRVCVCVFVCLYMKQ